MKYVVPLNDEQFPERQGAYVTAVPEAGIRGSTVGGPAIEHPMREIENCIVQAGLTPSEADLTQLAQVLSLLVPLSSFTGTNQSLGGYGYQNLPGGVILQWGRVQHTAGKGAEQAALFPKSFPTEVFRVVAVDSSTVNSRPIIWSLRALTKTGFSCHWTFGDVSSTTVNRDLFYIAIGR